MNSIIGNTAYKKVSPLGGSYENLAGVIVMI